VNFIDRYSKSKQITDFTKVHPVGSEFFPAVG